MGQKGVANGGTSASVGRRSTETERRLSPALCHGLVNDSLFWVAADPSDFLIAFDGRASCRGLPPSQPRQPKGNQLRPLRLMIHLLC